MYVSTGSTNISVSQNACPSYPGPVRPLAEIGRRSARAPAWSTWNSPNRTACWTSGSPSTRTSAASQNVSRYSRCARRSPSQPSSRAAASAAPTWSRSAGSDRRLDQPYVRYLTTRSVWPGLSTQPIVVRTQSWYPSDSMVVRSGPVTSWPMAAATRSPLTLVRWMSRPPSSVVSSSSACNGDSSTAATRGSRLCGGSDSFATSSDWRISRSGPSTASTS